MIIMEDFCIFFPFPETGVCISIAVLHFPARFVKGKLLSLESVNNLKSVGPDELTMVGFCWLQSLGRNVLQHQKKYDAVLFCSCKGMGDSQCYQKTSNKSSLQRARAPCCMIYWYWYRINSWGWWESLLKYHLFMSENQEVLIPSRLPKSINYCLWLKTKRCWLPHGLENYLLLLIQSQFLRLMKITSEVSLCLCLQWRNETIMKWLNCYYLSLCTNAIVLLLLKPVHER